MQLQSYMSVLYQLIRSDMGILKNTLQDKVINVCIWVFVSGVVYMYIMPHFGITQEYKQLLVVGLFASAALFEVFPGIMTLVTDINGDRLVDFYATLPIPNWVMFLRYFIFYVINACVIGLAVLFPASYLLYQTIEWGNVSVAKFFVAYLCANMFYSALSLWITAMVKKPENIGNIWMRYIFPVWFLGGFQFSWYGLHAVMPTFAYVDLINPYIHVMESYRVAFLGQTGYLPFWVSISLLIMFISVLLVHGIHRMKKYLDFI